MKKLLFIGCLLIMLGGGISYVLLNTSSDYEVLFDDTVADLEADLARLDAEIAAGTLTPTAAAAARSSILASLTTVGEQTSAAGGETLSAAQRRQLSGGLTRLKVLLVRYQATLVAVDMTAGEQVGSGVAPNEQSLQKTFLDTVGQAEEAIESTATPELEAAVDAIENEAPTTVGEVLEQADTGVLPETEAIATSPTEPEVDGVTESEESIDEEVAPIETATTTEEAVIEAN